MFGVVSLTMGNSSNPDGKAHHVQPPEKSQVRPEQNILVIGGSGSGKTRFFVKPSLMQMHSSYVVTDPKGYNEQG